MIFSILEWYFPLDIYIYCKSYSSGFPLEISELSIVYQPWWQCWGLDGWKHSSCSLRTTTTDIYEIQLHSSPNLSSQLETSFSDSEFSKVSLSKTEIGHKFWSFICSDHAFPKTLGVPLKSRRTNTLWQTPAFIITDLPVLFPRIPWTSSLGVALKPPRSPWILTLELSSVYTPVQPE